MIGTSLLIVIEGDPEVLEKSLLRAVESTTLPHTDQEEGEEEDEDEEEDMDEEGNATEDSLIPFEIKLIDFAHTTLSPSPSSSSSSGDGTRNEISEGVSKGVANLKDGLKRLVERLEKEEEEERKTGKMVRN